MYGLTKKVILSRTTQLDLYSGLLKSAFYYLATNSMPTYRDFCNKHDETLMLITNANQNGKSLCLNFKDYFDNLLLIPKNNIIKIMEKDIMVLSKNNEYDSHKKH